MNRPSLLSGAPGSLTHCIAMALVMVCSPAGSAESGWSHHGGSERGLQHSTARQINLENVSSLQEAWRFRTGELSQGSINGYSFQANPILAEGKLFFATGSSIVFAVNPATGNEIWRYDPRLDRGKSTSETGNRGVSSWIDNKRNKNQACYHRIYTGTLDGRLLAVDGTTGKPCQDFGNAGQVDLSSDVGLLTTQGYEYSVTSPPVIVGDLVISGSSIGDNRGVQLERGIVRGFNARSGKLIWSFDPIPRNAMDPAYSDWRAAEAVKNSAANAWAPLAADSDLGLVYVPTGSASPDFYGGEREGNNRYANSLVALEAQTGKVRWHQQLVHHDVWDFDLPAQPTLVDLNRGEQIIPAVIQATKMGLLFTFNRITGEPLFDIEERPVPQGGVAGEHLSKTQPFPVAPPPLLRHTPLSPEDAWGALLFDEWACARQIAALRSEGIYTPPSEQGSVMLPAYIGGINWGGVAFHPLQQVAVVRVTEVAAVVQLIKRENLRAVYDSGEYPDSQFSSQDGTPYGMRREVLRSPLGVPCSKPPWGSLVAVDMTRGEILWQVPHGTLEDLAPAPMPNLKIGVPGIGGPITTAGNLVFIAGAMDNYLRAFDLASGEEVWKARLPAGGQATPMSYTLNNKQYVVIAAGGHQGAGTAIGDYVIAFALPDGQ